MTKQVKTNNLNYSIDPRFNKVDRLFALSFKNMIERLFQNFMHQVLKQENLMY